MSLTGAAAVLAHVDATTLLPQLHAGLVADILKSNQLATPQQQWVMELLETSRLQARRIVLLERELEDALGREEARDRKVDSLERSAALLKRQNEKLERDKATSDAAAKAAAESLKKLTAAKVAVEKQFVFDLKKERKERSSQSTAAAAAAAAVPKSSSGPGPLEMRANAQLESVLRGLQAENRELRGELTALRKEANAVSAPAPVEMALPEFRIAKGGSREACRARMEVELLRQQVEIKDVMLRYICPQENVPLISNADPPMPAPVRNDELFDFFSTLSPMKPQ